MNNRIRMRHLRSFIEIAKQGSITKAAAVLNIAQPSLSRTLRELEEEIGKELFERTGQGLVLTSAGETYLRQAGVGLAQIDEAARRASGVGIAKAVVIGVFPNVARTLVPKAIASFKATTPKVDVRLIPGFEISDKLRRSEVDFIVGRLLGPEDLKGMSYEPLYKEPLVFAARPTHPLAEKSQITLAEIDRFPVVLPQPGSVTRGELDKFTLTRGLPEFANKVEGTSIDFTEEFLRNNDAVACVPLGSLYREIASGDLIRLNVHGEELMSSVGLTFMVGRRLDADAMRMADILRNLAKNLEFI